MSVTHQTWEQALSPLDLVNSHIFGAGRLTIAKGAHLLHLKTTGSAPPVGTARLRGQITSFSYQSRKRLMQEFASFGPKAFRYGAIWTCQTYADDYPTDPARWHYHARLFMEQVHRKYPQVGIVWRLEFQERGAPHFHFLILGVPFIHWSVLERWWLAIARPHWPEGVNGGGDTSRVSDWRGACRYMAKYLAKVDPTQLKRPIGRCWGVMFRENIPQEFLHVYLDKEQVIELKQVIRGVLPPGVFSPQFWDALCGVWTMQEPDTCKQVFLWVLDGCGPPVTCFGVLPD